MKHMNRIGALVLAGLITGFSFAVMGAGQSPPDLNNSCYAPTQELTPDLRKAFVDEISALAAKAEHDHGVPAPIIAAMSINESGYGTTQLALATHNILSYKWNGTTGPGGRKLFTLTCQPKGDVGNVYVVFKDRSDSADFIAGKLATSRYYKAATLAYSKAVASGADRKAAAKAWFTTIAPIYNPYQADKYIAAVLKAADDPLGQSGTRDEASNLWRLAAASTVSTPTVPADHTIHVAAVAKAQKAAYAISQSTNDCPYSAADILGWPAKLLKECDYYVGSKTNRRTAHVVLLDVGSEAIATWIETACSKQLPRVEKCFDTVLKCGTDNSGMMIPVSGNMMEDMDHVHWKNYFFRNGMTVSIGGEKNATVNQIDMVRQRELTGMPDTAITSIPSGVTRFWRTKSSQFAALFTREGAPSMLASPSDRQKWLDTARTELLAALEKPDNRLLDAWIAAHPKTLAQGACPKDDAP
jgi:hypothetical protein